MCSKEPLRRRLTPALPDYKQNNRAAPSIPVRKWRSSTVDCRKAPADRAGPLAALMGNSATVLLEPAEVPRGRLYCGGGADGSSVVAAHLPYQHALDTYL